MAKSRDSYTPRARATTASAVPHERCLDILQDDAADGRLDPEPVRAFYAIAAVPLPGTAASV